MAERGTFRGEVERGWARFSVLSWPIKAAIIGFAVLIVAAIIGNLAGSASRDDAANAAAPTAALTKAATTPTQAPTPATFEGRVMKSYSDNEGFIPGFAADPFNVIWNPDTGELDLEVYGELLTNGDALTRGAASGIIASKAIWTTYPEVKDLVVRLYADGIDKTTGQKSRSVVSASSVQRAQGEQFDYDGLKSLLAQDNKLWFCGAEGYGIAPDIYNALGNKGCLAQWGYLK